MATIPSLPEWHNHLRHYAEAVVAVARRAGAHAHAVVTDEIGLAVTVRRGQLDTIEHHRERTLAITVYLGHRTGHATTSDLSPRAIESAVAAALAIARHTAEDPAAGLPDPDWLANSAESPTLDLYHPWPLTAEEAILLAQRVERTGIETPGIVNSEGAQCATGVEVRAIANTLGFSGVTAESSHALGCTLLAQSDDGSLVRDAAWVSRRAPALLPAPDAIGSEAAQKTLARRNARKIATGRYPVIFSPEVAPSLIAHFVAAASGGALYRRASFLLERFDAPLFPSWFQLSEDPWLPQGYGSCPFDEEGVRVAPRAVVAEGRWVGRFLTTYSARKLGLTSTGNAGGAHNLLPTVTHPNQQALLADMGQGLLITELLGHGVNTVTGEYSRGAAGFWCEKGEIAYPVHEVTVAGLLPELYARLQGIADDARPDRRFRLGSAWIADVQVAGR